MTVLKNHLAVAAKNLLALIVKIVRDHQAYPDKVEPHKPVLIDLEQIRLKRAVMPISLKAQVLETQTPTPHAVLDAGSNE